MKKTNFLRLLKTACLAVAAVATVCTTTTLLSACGGGGGTGTGSITVREFLIGQKQIILNNTVCMVCTERDYQYNDVRGYMKLKSSGKKYDDIKYIAESADGNEDSVPTSVTMILPGNCNELSSDQDWLALWFGLSTHYDNMSLTNGGGVSGTTIKFSLQINGPSGTYTIESPSQILAHDPDGSGSWIEFDTDTYTGNVQVLPVN